MHSLNTDLYVNLLFCCRTNPRVWHTSESCFSLVRVVGCSNPPRLIPTVYFPRGLWYAALSTSTFLLYHCHCVKHEFIIKKIIHYKMLKCLSPPEVFGPVFRTVRFGSWVQILEKRVTQKHIVSHQKVWRPWSSPVLLWGQLLSEHLQFKRI